MAPAVSMATTDESGDESEGSTAPPGTEDSPTTLRVATDGFVDSFNPFTSVYLTPTNLIRYQYDTLMRYSADSIEPEPSLAESYEVSDDGMEWTFTLREDLKWSDDEPLTADDVAWSYGQLIDVPEMGVAIGNYAENIESVEAVDDRTVKFTMSNAQGTNPGLNVYIVPEHVWGELDDPSEFANDENTVTSGPFTLESYSPNESITLRSNPNFWRGEVAVDLQYVYYTNSDAMVQALRAGNVDFVSGLTPTQYDALENADGITTHSGEGRRFSSIVLNPGLETADGEPYGTGHPALQEVEVRQAIRQAVDRETLFQQVMDGHGVVATSWMPAIYEQWHLPEDSDVILDFDPEAAKQLLDDAGWTEGSDGIREKDGTKLELRWTIGADDPTNQSITDFVVPWLQDVGIAVDVSSTDSDTTNEMMNTGDYDIMFSGWSINPDPDFQLSINTCERRPTDSEGGGGTTQAGYCDPAFDELYNQQKIEVDDETRQDTVRQMLEMDYTASVTQALWYANTLEAYRSDRFEGFVGMPEGRGQYSNQGNYWGFLEVEPVEGATEDRGGASTGLLVTGGVIGVLILGGVAFLLMRRKNSADIE